MEGRTKLHYGGANREQKYGKHDEYKSRKQHYGGANREKFSRKPTVDEEDDLASSQTSTVKKSLQNSCKKQLPFAMPLPVSRVFVVSLMHQCSWGLLFAWRNTFHGCITETTTPCGPVRRHFFTNIDQNAIFRGKDNGRTYANPDLGMEMRWKH